MATLSRYEAAWRCFDDVEDAVGMVASAGLRVAVLTNGAQRQQDQKLEAVGLSRIGPVLSSEALGFAKPDPRAYQQACHQLGVAADQVLHISDRYDLDVVAARAAGLSAVYPDREDDGPRAEARRIGSLSQLDRFLQ